MPRGRLLGRLLLTVSLAATSGCKSSHPSATTAGLPASDAGPQPSDGATAQAPDAAPPDDSIPPTASDELNARARHLVEAIAQDDPELATDIIFPRAAWLSLRDVVDPGKDWAEHVERSFRRGVHALSRRHMDGAQFVSLELGHAVVREPVGRRRWKKTLWSVRGSRLTYVSGGHTRVMPIREMVAWRGAWYVTRLR